MQSGAKKQTHLKTPTATSPSRNRDNPQTLFHTGIVSAHGGVLKKETWRSSPLAKLLASLVMYAFFYTVMEKEKIVPT